jgi:hypothetical protein
MKINTFVINCCTFEIIGKRNNNKKIIFLRKRYSYSLIKEISSTLISTIRSPLIQIVKLRKEEHNNPIKNISLEIIDNGRAYLFIKGLLFLAFDYIYGRSLIMQIHFYYSS